jgi:hypothetical protein
MPETTDTREVGQQVWLKSNRWGSYDVWVLVTIEKVHKKYVDCSNGKSYNLTAGDTRGDERGVTTGRGDIGLYVTTIDKSKAYAEQQAKIRRDDDIDRIRGSIVKLSDSQLERVLAIIGEGPMGNANIAAIAAAKEALQCLLFWHSSGCNPGIEADACIEAQNAIDDLVQSGAIQKLKMDALARRKAEFIAKRGENNGCSGAGAI